MSLALTLFLLPFLQDAGAAKLDTSDAAVREAVEGGLAFLLESQNENGSWGGVRNATFTSGFANPATYHCWTVGTTGLATLAMLQLGSGEEAAAAVERGLDFLIANAVLTRPAEWDVDNVWGLVYGLDTLAKALVHPRYLDTDRGQTLRAAAETMIEGLAKYVSPRGGWGYYANPNANWQPEWATSFTTAVGVVALVNAREAGLEVPDKLLAATVRSVERCRQPNGAYTYSVNAFPRHLTLESINQVKGSLGRIQVGNYALYRAGAELPEGAMEEGIEQFFKHHKFLDAGRNKPIPHEAYYAVAAYFYLFGHYYAAAVIDTLPEEQRTQYGRLLRHEILKCRQKDGSFWDFWIASSTKPYGTAFSIMALAQTIEMWDGSR
jgi:hypothetical protein